MDLQTEEMSDARCRDLYEQFCRGERRASIELVNLFGNRLLQYVRRTCIYDNYAAAEDCVQNTWMKLLQHCGKPLKEASFWGFLCAIARNQAIDDYRAQTRQKRNPEGPMESLEEYHQTEWSHEHSSNPQQWMETLEEEQLQANRQQAFVKAMAELPAKQRLALNLWMADYSLKSIAAQMGEKEETVKSHIRYAKDKLKRLLLEKSPEVMYES